MKAKTNAYKKASYELLFHDSPDYFCVENAKMIFELGMVRFVCFIGDIYSHDEWYPMCNVQRIRRYAQEGK